MPFYHFHCKDCEKTFELMCSISDKEEHRAACPDCGSHELQQLFGGIGLRTRPAGGGSCGGNCSCCGGCGG